MITVEQHTFNPFQENTFLIYDETKEALVVDPGCYFPEEKERLKQLIETKELQLKGIISTHSHLDHVFGNKYIMDTFNVGLTIHREDLQTLKMLSRTAEMYGIPNVETSPEPTHFIAEGEQVKLGNSVLEVVFVPGHAPGHIAFISHEDRFVINGDCLFQGSIGRTDLPGGNMEQLLRSIREKIFSLPDDYTVYCGHGPSTTVGYEKENNPFLK
ncbi:MAG: MBL fold metallo-hydrolase [Flavobacteriales bacterium]|jgi:glyoxylase-like metal-dependent hydrolase (beta-lactamase superfamily II)|nr:MBL fold metallo-hydrolase [Flavobacteriales bacterium]